METDTQMYVPASWVTDPIPPIDSFHPMETARSTPLTPLPPNPPPTGFDPGDWDPSYDAIVVHLVGQLSPVWLDIDLTAVQRHGGLEKESPLEVFDRLAAVLASPTGVVRGVQLDGHPFAAPARNVASLTGAYISS